MSKDILLQNRKAKRRRFDCKINESLKAFSTTRCSLHTHNHRRSIAICNHQIVSHSAKNPNSLSVSLTVTHSEPVTTQKRSQQGQINGHEIGTDVSGHDVVHVSSRQQSPPSDPNTWEWWEPARSPANHWLQALELVLQQVEPV